jgi:hypothetical protein
MLKDFFSLDAPFERVDKAAFLAHLEAGKHIHSLLYEPDTLKEQKIEGKVFRNVSFSKTTISNVTFTNCMFKDCLFIGATLHRVNLHDCKFEDCNFFKAKLQSVYGKPHQFSKVVQSDHYANIAVHFFHQLRDNYYQESQREYKNEAEYYFAHWRRKNQYVQARRRNKKWYTYKPQNFGSFLYDLLLGYGYRVRNLAGTTITLLLIAIMANHTFSDRFFSTPIDFTFVETVYFTLTTMATLGAAGYTPDTETGYLFVIGNVVFGVSILSATLGAVFKKILR